jgi:hypothetical protein
MLQFAFGGTFGWIFQIRGLGNPAAADESRNEKRTPIRLTLLIHFYCTMKMNLIALTILGRAAVLLAGCAATTETTITTTFTREQSSMYAR